MLNTPSEELLLAGIIGAARGLRGEVSVLVHTDRPEEVFQPGSVLTTSSDKVPELEVSRARDHNGRLLLEFVGVNSREEAEELRGLELLVEGEDEDDAWYARDLEGLVVTDVDGNELGVVSGLMPSPAHDLLLVRSEGVEVMVPFVEAIVPQVLLEEGRIIVDAPSGLFPDPSVVGEEDTE